MKPLLHTAGALAVVLVVFILVASIVAALTRNQMYGIIPELIRAGAISGIAMHASLAAARTFFKEHSRPKIIATAVVISAISWAIFIYQTASQLPPWKVNETMALLGIVISVAPPIGFSFLLWKDGWEQ